ncbi:MAG: fasciclin domain-containing protein [Ginsengibacter sp.]
MKINNLKKYKSANIFLLLGAVVILASCNKDLPNAQPIPIPDSNPVGTSLGMEISTNPDYSIYKAAATRVGMLPLLMDSSKVFTILLPNNAAFIASGIPSVDVINALPISSVGGIVQFSMIPGEQWTSDKIPETFPNIQLPTSITIGVLPGTTIPLKMSVFLSKRGSNVWANTIPVVKADNKFRNGVIHVMAAVVSPASQVLRDAMYANPELAYFKAAIARADSGQSGLAKLDSLLGYGVTNMTVLAPNNAAFQTLIFGLAFQGYLSQVPNPTAMDTAIATATGNGAVAAGPAFLSTNNVSTALVKGLMAYHFLATNTPAGFQPNIRVFSNNFATTPTLVTTLVNAGVAVHPGILAQATFAPGSPFVATLTFTGYAGAAVPFGSAPAQAVQKDKFAINGVYHVIDKVLLPQ